MALQILENNGTFNLEGTLNATTARFFIIHFEYLINTVKDITVDIGDLKYIDENGVEALKTLMAIALRNNNIFSVVGDGCRDVYDDYRSSFAA